MANRKNSEDTPPEIPITADIINDEEQFNMLVRAIDNGLKSENWEIRRWAAVLCINLKKALEEAQSAN